VSLTAQQAASSFVEFASVHGLLIDDPINDGILHRVPTDDDKPGKRSGAYVYHGKYGHCWNWKLGGETEYWTAEDDDRPTQNLHDREIELRRRRSEEKAKQAEAAEKAGWLWDQAKPSDGSHPYLQNKQVKPHGLRRTGAVLLIPLYGVDGNLATLQKVPSDGSKRFIPGGKTKACQHTFGDVTGAERVLICEGWATGATLHEATGCPVICAMNCGNLQAIVEQFKENREVMICADDDYRTQQKKGRNPGLDKANEVAKEFRIRTAIPIFDQRGEGTDFNDLQVACGLDTVRQQIEQAWCGEPQKYRLDEISVRLAKMPLEKFAAEIPKWQEYFGLNKQQLTEEVARTRGQNEQGNPSALSQLEPWPDPVDGAELLNQLVSECCRFLVLPDHGDVMLAAWTLHTYCFEQFDYSPILHVTSPTKQCAKSRVLEVLAKLAHNPKSSSNMTAATMFRTIETRKPTLLLDEMDRSPKDKKEMITIVLNAGFHRDGKVDRCEGDEHKVKTFGVYCPKALAGIGDYTTDTVTDRSIQLSMQKKLKSQEVEKFRRYQNEELQRKCVRWAKDNLDMLASSRPQMPQTLSDRQEDIWECLFAIAEIAGGEWPQKVWDAASAQAADSVAQVTDDLVLPVALRQYFTENPSDKAASKEICDWLNDQDDLPFKDWRRTQGIDPRILARKLKLYGITPRNLNLGGSSRLKGYLLEELERVFQRYLPPDNPPIQPLPATTPEKAGRNEDSHPLPDDTVADSETADSACKNGQSSAVADGEGVCPAVQEEPAYVEEF